jgi:hypothetical protein
VPRLPRYSQFIVQANVACPYFVAEHHSSIMNSLHYKVLLLFDEIAKKSMLFRGEYRLLFCNQRHVYENLKCGEWLKSARHRG